MPCFHPLKAIRVSGQTRVKIMPRMQSDRENDHWLSSVDLNTGECFEEFCVPCGNCIGCRLDYSRIWADRIMMDASFSRDNYFVTLTYDDEHLPFLNDDSVLPTLVPNDLSLFMKRLRSRLPESTIRFFGSGEYGETTRRPHYHLCLLGCPIPDLVFYKANPNGDPLYSSLFMDDVWARGFSVIAPLNWETSAYTARYVLKKRKGRDSHDYYDRLGVCPEFVRMSRRPGLGRAFLLEHQDDLLSRRLFLPSNNGKPHPVCLSPYFDKIMKDIRPDDLARAKSIRQQDAIIRDYSRRLLHGYGERQYLCINEEDLQKRTKILLSRNI